MRMIGRVTLIVSVAWSLVGLVPSAIGQTVENPVKFDVSPAFRSIQPPARPQGAFFREHVVKKLPLPPEKLAALADTALQKTATTRLPIGPIKAFQGIGRENFSITSDPPGHQRLGRQNALCAVGQYRDRRLRQSDRQPPAGSRRGQPVVGRIWG